ncbi:hypothetical protein P7K49_013530 [Saguinus oedipus]|uniref:AP complex mu/sigma subunit domain-containing protein n=1 Tax=Saguinus oedipus TaxID=9490 RepID=A0ABQ9VG61_SAGOE|nr:hypothetical protein P7K49_013530 [Saguinus oedipus]
MTVMETGKGPGCLFSWKLVVHPFHGSTSSVGSCEPKLLLEAFRVPLRLEGRCRHGPERRPSSPVQLRFVLPQSPDVEYGARNRQGKLRLQKWYVTLPDKERKKITREIVPIILSRVDNQDNELLTLEIVHRYVELLDKYFGNEKFANAPVCLGFLVYALNSEVPQLATIGEEYHVLLRGKRWGGVEAFNEQSFKRTASVCELDIIFNFEKAYFILDEFIIGGEIQETSKKIAVKAIEDSDMLQETLEKEHFAPLTSALTDEML